MNARKSESRMNIQPVHDFPVESPWRDEEKKIKVYCFVSVWKSR